VGRASRPSLLPGTDAYNPLSANPSIQRSTSHNSPAWVFGTNIPSASSPSLETPSGRSNRINVNVDPLVVADGRIRSLSTDPDIVMFSTRTLQPLAVMLQFWLPPVGVTCAPLPSSTPSSHASLDAEMLVTIRTETVRTAGDQNVRPRVPVVLEIRVYRFSFGEAFIPEINGRTRVRWVRILSHVSAPRKSKPRLPTTVQSWYEGASLLPYPIQVEVPR